MSSNQEQLEVHHQKPTTIGQFFPLHLFQFLYLPAVLWLASLSPSQTAFLHLMQQSPCLECNFLNNPLSGANSNINHRQYEMDIQILQPMGSYNATTQFRTCKHVGDMETYWVISFLGGCVENVSAHPFKYLEGSSESCLTFYPKFFNGWLCFI